jgi:radical SAM protein with 4Fe4S-binding SPASM domain
MERYLKMASVIQLPLEDSTTLRAPAYSTTPLSGALIAVDPAAPHWIATDDRGIQLLALFDGQRPLRDVVSTYASLAGLDVTRAWLHVETFARDLLRQGFVTVDGASPAPYPGRAAYLRTDSLRELWLHVNDFCNLACGHCLVSSGPDQGQGWSTPKLLDAIDQGAALGVERFFLTGGEPLARPGVFDLARRIVQGHQRELVILTNGTLFTGNRLEDLAALAGERLRVQISLDGASAGTNDPIRGEGTFDRIVEGITAAVAAGLRPSMTMVLLAHNLGDVEPLVQLAGALRVENIHLLWPHRRGRVLNGPFAKLPTAEAILEAVRRGRAVAATLGVTIDNIEEFRLRLDGRPGVKNDLSGAGWNSLCVYTDGCVYPSPSTAGVPELQCGSLNATPLEQIWRESAVMRELREATVERKPLCGTCSLKFLCGGGDVEHGYWATRSFVGHDPYCELYKGLAADAFAAMAVEGRATVQPRSGFDRPVVFRAM